jgi:hypothetical protein
MRKNQHGEECPETLGEYRDLCAMINGSNNRAVAFLDGKIALQGRESKVIAPDLILPKE